MASTTNPPTPAEKLASDIAALQNEVNRMHDDVRLARIRDEVEDLQTKTNGLPSRINTLRTNGYLFGKWMTGRAANLMARWNGMAASVQMQINQQATQLDLDMRNLDSIMMQLAARQSMVQAAQPLLAQAKAAKESLASKVTAAESTVRGAYNEIQREVNVLVLELDRIEWSLKELAKATFKLKVGEGLILAVKAKWVKNDDKNDPKGIFYLTDQRMLFEQKEEVATKKVLFVTTERKLIQELEFEAPLALVESITPTKQGVFKNEDHLEFTFGSGAPYARIHLHLDGQDCREWQALVNRVKAGEYEKDRAVEVSAEEKERLKNAPTICPQCGGQIKQEIYVGMTSVTCAYCGFVIRI